MLLSRDPFITIINFSLLILGYLSILVSKIYKQEDSLAKSTTFGIASLIRNFPAGVGHFNNLFGYVLSLCYSMYCHSVTVCIVTLLQYVLLHCYSIYCHSVTVCIVTLLQYVLLLCYSMYCYSVTVCIVTLLQYILFRYCCSVTMLLYNNNVYKRYFSSSRIL